LLSLLCSLLISHLACFDNESITDGLTLPYLWSGQAVIPSQHWDCISLAQCASLNVT